MQNFWYSYQNILRNEFLKKNYLAFLRKIFGVIYKFIVRYFKKKFLINLENLDKSDKNNFSKDLDTLFIDFNCDKGSYFFLVKKKLNHIIIQYFMKNILKVSKIKELIYQKLDLEGKGLAGFFIIFQIQN